MKKRIFLAAAIVAGCANLVALPALAESGNPEGAWTLARAGQAGFFGPKVTYAKYQQIRNGMTYSQVAAIIGFDGEELSRNQIAGITTVMYQWQNKNGANMNAMFQNGALIQKAQYGLK
ncbi:hypothetical protein D3C72_577940 [compost metagenome]